MNFLSQVKVKVGSLGSADRFFIVFDWLFVVLLWKIGRVILNFVLIYKIVGQLNKDGESGVGWLDLVEDPDCEVVDFFLNFDYVNCFVVLLGGAEELELKTSAKVQNDLFVLKLGLLVK